jgi:hypothetical protein
MVKRCILMAGALVLLAAAADRLEAGEFKFLSRSLMQGPSWSGAFHADGFILGTGGGIVLFPSLANPGETTYLSIEGQPRCIAVRAGVAYIAADRGGLVTVDLVNPSGPRVTHSFTRSRRAISCSVLGNTLLLLDTDRVLYTFDLVKPLEPGLLHGEKLPFTPLWVATEGGLIAVIGNRKAILYTLSPDGRLQKLSEVAFPDNVKRGTMHDGILYAITINGSVERWNLETADTPEALSPLPVDATADLAFSGSRGLVLTKSHKVIPLELSAGREAGGGNPPGRYHTRGRDPNLSSRKPKMGSPLKLTGQEKLGEDSTGDFLLRKIRSILLYGNFLGKSIVFDGSRFATIAGKNGVFFFSLEGTAGRYIGNMTTQGFAVDLIASNGRVYVANGNDGLRIGEVHGDGSVDWIGHLQTTEARDLVLSGSTLALCDGSGGFKTIDVSDPANPRVIGTRSSPFYNSALVSREQRAYIAGGLGGVEVLDFTDAAHPKLLWRDEFSEVRGIHVDPEYLYFADGFDGFRIYSITIDKPQPVSVLDTEGWNCDCFVLGDVAYIADGGNGVKVVDIADRKHPTLVGSVDLGALTRNVHAVPGMVFAAVHTSGIAAIDVSDPANPVVTAKYRTVDDGRGVYVDDRFVYLASGSGGVYIFKYEH